MAVVEKRAHMAVVEKGAGLFVCVCDNTMTPTQIQKHVYNNKHKWLL